LYAYKVECGPGHGISIGSLGNQNSEAQVSDITIDTAHVTGTLYGARIKTWQGGSGYARDIKFLNMVMDKVKHPISIDQYYRSQQDPSNPRPCEEQKSAVPISNVLFKNIRGSGTTKDVISLHCSKAFPCRDVDLKMRGGGGGKKTMSSCENARGHHA
jgi:polygalacturonase